MTAQECPSCGEWYSESAFAQCPYQRCREPRVAWCYVCLACHIEDDGVFSPRAFQHGRWLGVTEEEANASLAECAAEDDADSKAHGED